MGKIVLLDDLSINKIAAGEVIERPASVIKEMVENSIDAGATNITIEIKNGGISYIRVTDNGKGISEDDLEMAFERHATSKIRNATDLDKVKSMGFRGEALASIAAIANVELISKTQEQDNGYKIVVEGGNILLKETAGSPNGTSITVRNLFYNTPVRYKFLKKDYTESGYIEDVVSRIAQSYPEIAIKLINTGKTIIQTNGNGDLKTVIYSIYGKDISENVINVNYEYEDIKITGILGKPEIARSNRGNQMFFINKRYIKDKILSQATEQALKGMIPIGKFPFLSINIELDPSKVDVNVHPSKLEVRFSEEDKIFKAVYHAIKDTLIKGNIEDKTIYREPVIEKINTNQEEKKTHKIFDIIPVIHKTIEKKQENTSILEENKTNELIQDNISQTNIIEDIIKERTEKETNQTIKENDSNQIIEKQDIKSNSNNEENEKTNYQIKEELNTEEKLEEGQAKYTFEEMYMKTFGRKPYAETENVSIFENIKNFKKPDYKIVGIAFKTYIIIEMNEEMYIIDQHAAHERIMYEKIKKNYYTNNQKDTQIMLLPDIITLTHKEMEIARENMEIFEKSGFILEEFGENTIKLSGVPDICIDLDTKELFLETLDEISGLGKTAKQEIEEKFIATVACKSAVKANMALDEKEIKSLMDNLLELPNPFTCPHGRPTCIKMTKYEIERKFARK